MNKLRNIVSFYDPRFPRNAVYMLQQVEYDPKNFLAWLLRLPNVSTVMQRQVLVKTKKAQCLLFIAYFCWLLPILLGLIGLYYANTPVSLVVIFLAPLCVISSLCILVLIGNVGLNHSRKTELIHAQQIMDQHKGIKIAVLGSYGKTTMKELLLTVLGEGKAVKATPGNKNVVISHARWVNKYVTGNEDVLIIEYGEAKQGDIQAMARLTSPNMAIITGLAPNHLDGFKTLQVLTDDLLSICNFVSEKQVFVSGDAADLLKNKNKMQAYSADKVLDWQILDIVVNYAGVAFSMERGKELIELESPLLGKHQVPVLALVGAIAHKLGLSKHQIVEGISKTLPFEHRMQPRLINGAWIIDDTYNGSLGGIKAGLELLRTLPAQRKIYVTPGLVEQGDLKQQVHQDIAGDIYKTKPDVLILMKNSATEIIHIELKKLQYKGVIQIQSNPLAFYENLEHYIAAGDLVLMQNDWTDNYI